MMCHLQGDHAQALTTSASALAVARALGHVRLECATVANMGLIHTALGQQQEAETHIATALGIAQMLGDTVLEGVIRSQIALPPQCADRPRA
jgi:hypothetical protein